MTISFHSIPLWTSKAEPLRTQQSYTLIPRHLGTTVYLLTFQNIQIIVVQRKIFPFCYCKLLLDPTDPFHFNTVSLSLSLGDWAPLVFPQDLIAIARFSNCIQLGTFLFCSFLSFLIHFLSELSFWWYGFVLFKENMLVCVFFKSISMTQLKFWKFC